MPSFSQRRRRRSARRQAAYPAAYVYDSSAPEMNARLKSWAPASPIPWSKAPDLLLLTLLAALLFFFFADNRFYVAGITLSGNSLVSAEEICQATHLRFWSIFYINTQQAKEDVLRKLPAVRAISVRCRLPAQVTVIVQEREPQVVWETRNGRFLVDREGVVLRAAEANKEMPLVRDQSGQTLKPGDKGQVNKLAVQTAWQIHELIGEAWLLDYTPEKGIAWTDANGWQVFFGTGGDIAVKVANLEAMLREMRRLGVKVEYIDLRFEQVPFYREVRRP